MTDLVRAISGGTVIVVQPGFNGVVTPEDLKALTSPADETLFDQTFLDATAEKSPFVLVLGSGFENAEARQGLIMGPCSGLASAAQLRLLQDRGLSTIVMARPHPTLVQNARSVGVEVIFGGNEC